MPPSTPTPSGESRPAGLPAGRAVLPLVPGFGRRPARPLPDAAAVRLSAVPDCAPPYDDDPAGARAAARTAGTRPAPPGPPPPSERRAECRPERRAECRPERRAEPGAWPGRFAQVLAETLAGSRPQVQMRPWTTDQALRRIRQLGPMLAAGVQPRVRRIVTSRPAAGVVEMSVIVGVGPSVRALAVRLERDHGEAGWVCTAVEAA
jgi:hypothetical protein